MADEFEYFDMLRDAYDSMNPAFNDAGLQYSPTARLAQMLNALDVVAVAE